MKTSEAPLDRSQKAQRVRQLLDEVQFYDMMQTARDEVIADFTNSEPHESKKREAAYQVLAVMEQVERHIVSILSDGTVANMQLDRSKKHGR